MTARESEILSLIASKPDISQNEIAEELNIARSSVAVHISNLMKKGKIVGKGYILQEDRSVCVIGAVNVDIIAKAYDELVKYDSNPGTITYSFGGVGRNIAKNLALLKQKIELITVLGDDLHGTKIVDECNKLGINTRNSLRASNQNTSTYLCIADPRGEMELAVSAMELYDLLTPEFLKTKLNVINRCKLLVIDTNISEEAIEFLVNHVKVPIFVDPVSTKKALKIKPYIGKFHTIKPNVMELEVLVGREINTNKDVSMAAKELLRLGVKNVFVSLGSRGIYYTSKRKSSFKRNFKTKIVNSTGCGDAFMAGLVYAFINDFKIEDAARCGLNASRVTLQSHHAVNPDLKPEDLESR
ncbi:winged helix-turn-helix transcriptional regulator [Erysipelotrichaceae bacterium OH741_COT-311]|nr:winged helix-turn-helix transcriptional regulator [Erysipelotrichaceae bacterium OH741_COT-311]